MTGDQLPGYAVFDDYVLSQRIAVVVRWFLLLTWFVLINYRPDIDTVKAEREEASKNLALQKRAAQAELEAQMERDRISREIHDGIAQSMLCPEP